MINRPCIIVWCSTQVCCDRQIAVMTESVSDLDIVYFLIIFDISVSDATNTLRCHQNCLTRAVPGGGGEGGGVK